MSSLTRIAQVGLKIEAVEGTAETLSHTEFERNTKDSNFNPTMVRYERGVKRAALSHLKDLVGGKMGEISWKEEMTGGTVSTEAPWYATIQACGMQKVTLKKITVTSPSGTFKAGDIISASAGSKTGRVAKVATISSVLKIWYEPLLSAFVDTDAITSDAGSPATGTVSGAPVSAGFSHKPMSENGSQIPPSATVEYHDPDYTERLVGARGTFSISMNFGEPPLIDAKFTGPRQIKDVDGTPLDPGLVANVAVAPAPAFLFGDIGFPMQLDAFDGVFDQATFDIGNTTTERKTVGQGGPIAYVTQGYGGGYMPTRITDRRPTFKIDPETPAESTKPLMKNWHSNTDMRLHVSMGQITATGQNCVCINGPRAGIVSNSFQQGDRNGIRTLSLELMLTGPAANDDEVYIDHCYS